MVSVPVRNVIRCVPRVRCLMFVGQGKRLVVSERDDESSHLFHSYFTMGARAIEVRPSRKKRNMRPSRSFTRDVAPFRQMSFAYFLDEEAGALEHFLPCS